jgi:superfamily II DNA or RNA helicase
MSTAMQLRPYQVEAKNAILSEWEKGVKKTLLVLPTGVGKTIVFSSVIEDCVRVGQRVLILAHRGELLDQAADKLTKTTGLKCAIEKAEESCLDSWYRVTVGSVQSMMRPKRLSAFPLEYFDTIIIDEAHHALAEGYQRILQHFSESKVLGVTATPERGDLRELGEYFESLAYEYSLPRAIRDGFLCPIKAQTIPLRLDLSAVSLAQGDFKASDLGTALDPYLERIADEMVAAGCLDRKTVVFLPLVKTAQKFANILRDRRFACAEVNGGSHDRAEILRRFASGSLNVICNAMLLTEGWDQPDVDCIVVLRPTKIRSLYCLDEKTEILTRDGWKKSINVGEDVAAFDTGSEEIVFTPALDTVRRQLDSDEFFVSLSGPSTDIRVTNKHRMLYDNKRRKGWKIKTAEQISNLKDGCIIPVAGKSLFEGVPLTDDELRFIGWVMTDGTINKSNNAIYITQGEHQSWCDEIERCIKGCGFKFGKRVFHRKTQFSETSRCVSWSISFGSPRGRDKHLQGWSRLKPYLSKDISPLLFHMTEQQFNVMLEAIHLADGRKQESPDWVQRSYHISKGNALFIERLQIMALMRGYRANIAVEEKGRLNPIFTLHLKKQNFIHVGSTYDGRPTWIREPHTDETCWCVTNRLGTLVTRRNGKVTIVGNCQMIGRGTRIHPGKDHLLILDFLWHTERHELCRPAHLICETKEVVDQMTENIQEAGCPVDIQEAQQKASEDAVIAREESLAKILAEMRVRKRKLVDPLQFEMSIQSEDLLSYIPSFGWEMNPPSEAQIKTLEKMGIFPDEINSMGKASMLLDRLNKRRHEGLTTPKQIRFLESKGFQHVGTWPFDGAKSLIDRIAGNGWRVPHSIDAGTYVPASGGD